MRITLQPSDHVDRGLIIATQGGQIVWYGAAKDIGQARGFDLLHVNSCDLPTIKAAMQKKQLDVRVKM